MMKFKLGNVLQQGSLVMSVAIILDTIMGYSDLSVGKCILLFICLVGWMVGLVLIDDYMESTQKTIDELKHRNKVLTEKFNDFVELVKDNFR